MGRTDIYRVREKKDVFVLKLLKTKVEGSATARAEFEKERSCLVALSARVHPGNALVFSFFFLFLFISRSFLWRGKWREGLRGWNASE